MKQKLSSIITSLQNTSRGKRVLLIIILLVILTLIILLPLILVRNSSEKLNDDTAQESVSKNLLYSTLLFTPDTIALEPGRIQSTSIVLDLGSNTAKRISFTVRFNPNSVSLVDLIQKINDASPLSNSFITETINISAEDGTAQLILKLKEGATEQFGKGEVAQFSYKINPQYTGKLGFTIENVSIESDKAQEKSFSTQTNTLKVTQQL